MEMEKHKTLQIATFYFRGCLVYVDKSETTIELRSLRLSQDHTEFGIELDSIPKLTSKFHWEIEDVQAVVDDRTGIEEACILASRCYGKSTDKKFFIVQAKWRGSSFFCHSLKTPSKSYVDLIPFMEFIYSSPGSKSPFCSLLRGPRVILSSQDVLLLFVPKQAEFNSKGKNLSQKQEFSLRDLGRTSERLSVVDNNSEHFKHQMFKILAVISEQNWIVVLLFDDRQQFSSVIAIALERSSETDDFNRNVLRTGDFVPAEYLSRVSSLSIQQCQQIVSESGACWYENVCAVGLHGGYVMTFNNGIMQTCVTLWTFTDIVHPAFSVTRFLSFTSDILICCTDSKQCYVVNKSANKVVHRWDDVQQAVVGDFLHNGQKQLLLLFGSGSHRELHTSFFLTDLQGYVVDQRQASGDDTDGSLIVEDKSGLDDQSMRNLQPVVNALQQQNQMLTKKVAHDEQKLASKQLFVAETWRHLLNLSVCGPGSVVNIPQPEVPLVPLVSGNRPTVAGSRATLQTASHLEQDVTVKSLWHRLLDNTCIVGVKVFCTSKRDLQDCFIVLTSSSPQPMSLQQCSVKTRMWNTVYTDYTQSAATSGRPSDISAPKRLRVEHGLRVHPVNVIRSLESVTITGLFDVPDLGFLGRIEQYVHLMYSMAGGPKDGVCTQGEDVQTQTPKGAFKGGREDGGVLTSRSVERPEPGDESLKRVLDKGKRKCVMCGKVVWKASDLLQQKEDLSWLKNEQVLLSDQERNFEEELLALSSVQQSWPCDVSFVLHQATEMPQCLHRAGFVFHGQLGQYVASPAAPQCLHYVRIQQLGFQPLPQRAMGILVFARNSNQLLLLIQHLYTFLPEDARIALTLEEQRSAHLQHVVSTMSTQLSQRKTQARAIVDAHADILNRERNLAGLQQSARSDHSSSEPKKDTSAALPDIGREREEFSKQQAMYRQKERHFVREEHVSRFQSVVDECRRELDMAMTKLKL